MTPHNSRDLERQFRDVARRIEAASRSLADSFREIMPRIAREIAASPWLRWYASLSEEELEDLKKGLRPRQGD